MAPGRVLKVLSGGLASSKVLEAYARFLSHEFTPGGKVEYHLHIPVIALAAGRSRRRRSHRGARGQMFGVLVAKQAKGWDHSALLTLIEEGSR